METSVTWERGMRSAGRGASSGFSLPLDSNPAVGGEGSGFRPMELMLLCLAGCTAMDVISILQKKNQPVEHFEVQVHGERAVEHPRVYTHPRVKYRFHGKGIDTAGVARAIELSKTTYRIAEAMLSRSARVELPFEIVEDTWPAKAGGG